MIEVPCVTMSRKLRGLFLRYLPWGEQSHLDTAMEGRLNMGVSIRRGTSK